MAKIMKSKDAKELLQILCEITDAEDMRKLLEDLCTPRELEDMTQRLQVAKLLGAGTNYSAIQRKTGASATTIARVSRALNLGTGGYAFVMDPVEKTDEEKDIKTDVKSGVKSSAKGTIKSPVIKPSRRKK